MIVDILTATQTKADGVSTKSWLYKETRIVNWSPIGFGAKTQLKVALGGEEYPADSRAWLEHNSDVVAGNRLSYLSGTTYYDVLGVYAYEDHTEADLRKVVKP